MNTPNKITTVRLFAAVLMVIIFSLSFIPSATSTWAKDMVVGGFQLGFNWIDLVCCIIFITGSITDAVDGHIARSRKLVTDLGKFLDPLADKFLVDGAFILLASKADWYGHYQVLPILVVFFVGRDLAMDGLRMIANGKGKVLAANIWGKFKTAMQMGVIPVLFLKGFPFSMLNISGGLDNWMANRWEYTYIVTNILVLITLGFSLASMIIYFVRNKDVLKEEKK
jgi:CDP-diacylglycerol--glycerol-3-phosphate 3-phosphatidyltransferase